MYGAKQKAIYALKKSILSIYYLLTVACFLLPQRVGARELLIKKAIQKYLFR